MVVQVRVQAEYFCKYLEKGSNELIREVFGFKHEGRDVHLKKKPADKSIEWLFSAIEILKCKEDGEVFNDKCKINEEHWKDYFVNKKR